MLKISVQASIPIIGVHTDDIINSETVLETVLGIEIYPFQYSSLSPKVKLEEDTVYFLIWTEDEKLDLNMMYDVLADHRSTLVLINFDEPHPVVYDVGELSVPQVMVTEFVAKHTNDKDQIIPLARALSGLTFKQVVDISTLAMTEHGEFTPRSVNSMRKRYFSNSRGLQQIGTDYLFYTPPEFLLEWLAVDGRLFIEDSPDVLAPRGLLFSGTPGTGKTMAAKFLAKRLELPLYYLDIGSVLSKWLGESEKQMRMALQQAERAAPCVLLIDEVEKLFRSDESGVTSKLLSQVLWWLQERRSRVLTLMTTNDVSSIPPELYRPGRIDKQMHFELMELEEGLELAYYLAEALEGVQKIKGHAIDGALKNLIGQGQVSPAQITSCVMALAKTNYVEENFN